MKTVQLLACLLALLAPLGAEPGRVEIFYIQPELEMKLSSGVQRGGLPLPLLRVGVARVQERLYAQLHFKALGAPREVVQRQAAVLARRAFKLFPSLVQVDLVGVDRLEHKQPLGKPRIFFSASIRRNRFLAQPVTWSPAQQVNSVGAPYYSADCAVGTSPHERLCGAASRAWQRSAKREKAPIVRKPASR